MDDTSYDMHFIPLDEISDAWAAARRFILAANKAGGEMTEEQIIYNLMKGKMSLFLWCEEDKPLGAMTVELIQYPTRKVAHVHHLGGDFGAMVLDLAKVEDWAISCGASALLMNGRRGWLRKLKPLGFFNKFVTMEKTLWADKAVETKPKPLQ